MTSDDGGWVERSVKVRVRYRYPHSHSIVLTDGSVDPIPKKFPSKTSTVALIRQNPRGV
jgi:hypothetical protein